jgi:8-oxo-dGTP pyrophosphatase MutT (NUDIX family)
MTRPIQSDGRLHGVVVGCRGHDGRWLMIRRSRAVAAPLRVCFPGGAVEVGESLRDAAVRELREELALDIQPIRRVWRHDFDDQPLTLWGWLAEMDGRTPRPDPDEVDEVLWLTDRQLDEHPDVLPYTDLFHAALLDAEAGRRNFCPTD